MAYTQADLDALKAAYASGVRVVEYAGRRTEFNSPADLRRAISDVEAELGVSTTPATTVGVYSSGLQSPVVDRRGWRRGWGC